MHPIHQADANLGVYPAELSELRESFGESQDGYVTLAEVAGLFLFGDDFFWGKVMVNFIDFMCTFLGVHGVLSMYGSPLEESNRNRLR